MVNLPLPEALDKECLKASKTLKSFTMPETAGGIDAIIPPSVIDQAMGLVILTVVKAGFLFSGRVGFGLVVAKLPNGTWSAPSSIGTASFGAGLQIGAELTDFVIVLNTERAVDAFSYGGNVALGGNLSVAAGPIGRNAEAAAMATVAATYSYSKTKGLFAGISLEGTVFAERSDANEKLYGRKVTARELLSGAIPPPPEATALYEAIKRHETGFKTTGAALPSAAGRPSSEQIHHDNLTYPPAPSVKTYQAPPPGYPPPSSSSLPPLSSFPPPSSSSEPAPPLVPSPLPPSSLPYPSLSPPYPSSPTPSTTKPPFPSSPPLPSSLDPLPPPAPPSTSLPLPPTIPAAPPPPPPPISHPPMASPPPMTHPPPPPPPMPMAQPPPPSSPPKSTKTFAFTTTSSPFHLHHHQPETVYTTYTLPPSSSSSSSHSSPPHSSHPTYPPPPMVPISSITTVYSSSPFPPPGLATAIPSSSSSHPPPLPTRSTSTQARARALYDFYPLKQGDLSFKAGDVINVTERTANSQDWWRGSLAGREGAFPANYVQII